MIDGFVAAHPDIPVCMHLDHGNEPGTCATAIQHGFTSVMMDGSLKADGKTPADFDYNAGVRRRVREMAHACGVSVEGEIGVLGSLETGGGEQEDGHGFVGALPQGRCSRHRLPTPADATRRGSHRHPCSQLSGNCEREGSTPIGHQMPSRSTPERTKSATSFHTRSA